MRLVIAALLLASSGAAAPVDPSKSTMTVMVPQSTGPTGTPAVFEGVSVFNPSVETNSAEESLVIATAPIEDVHSAWFGSSSDLNLKGTPSLLNSGNRPPKSTPKPEGDEGDDLVMFTSTAPEPSGATPAVSLSASQNTDTDPPPPAAYNASDLPFRINAPGGDSQWWVLNETNYLFATPPSGLDLRVGLTKRDGKQDKTDWDLGGFTCDRGQDPPVCVVAVSDLDTVPAGDGYMLYLTRADSRSTIIGVSDTFKIEPAGSPKSGGFTISFQQHQPSTTIVPSSGQRAHAVPVLAVLGLLSLLVVLT